MAISYDFSDEQRHTIITITVITACISLLGELFIFTLFSRYKSLRNFPFRYVFFLSTADFINSIGFLLVNDNLDNQDEANFLCKLQAFFINYGELSSICWTTVIACPIITADYGKAGGWCWIKIDKENKWKSTILRLIEFYLPLWIAFFYNGITIYKVVKFVKNTNLDDKDKKLVYKLKYYPLILFICWTFATIDRITNYFGLESFTLHVVNILFSGIQGFLNACIYGLSNKVKSMIKQDCPCIKSDLSDNIEDSQNENKGQQQQNTEKKDDQDPQIVRNQQIELQLKNQIQQPQLSTE